MNTRHYAFFFLELLHGQNAPSFLKPKILTYGQQSNNKTLTA
ncbi:hypothetical protein [Flavobacterium johnsoniae]|nr:hypothetical protein [Flavobacterium johnsoniae]